MLTVPNLEAEILNILKLLEDVQVNGCFVTVSQGHIQTSGGSLRNGAFHQMPITIGRTACSVNGAFHQMPITIGRTACTVNGAFHQMPITIGRTACTVNGAFYIIVVCCESALSGTLAVNKYFSIYHRFLPYFQHVL